MKLVREKRKIPAGIGAQGVQQLVKLEGKAGKNGGLDEHNGFFKDVDANE